MDLFPHARRALLTAYADTDAAIQAINVVDLDHYLLKPWDPPEEKLYPGRRLAHRDVAGRRRAAGESHPGRRPSMVGPLVRGSRLPGPQLGALPLAHERGARGSAAAVGGRRRCHRDPARRDAGGRSPRRSQPRRPRRPRGALDDARPSTSTTSLSSAGDRPGSAPPSTPHRKACARCWSNGEQPEGRRVRARGSRTISGSPTASPEPSSRTGLAGRRTSSAPRSSPPATSSVSTCGPRHGPCASTTATRSSPTPSCWPPGISYRKLDVPGADGLTGRRRVLRFDGHRGAGVRGRRGLHRRRRQLGRPGGSVPRPPRPARHDADPGRQPGVVDVALPHPPDRRRSPTSTCGSTPR